MKNIIYSFCLLILFYLLFLNGCTDNNSTQPSTTSSSGKGTLKLYLVDSVNGMDSVVIAVSRVDVHKSGPDSTNGWITLNDSLRYFNLLDLTNGAKAVLGNAELDAGNYTQIRLILADSNYVVDTNGVRYHLTVPSGTQTGIKLVNNFTISDGNIYELYLDFNLSKSIIITGNGNYKLKPTIKVVPIIISGSISGKVLPLDADAVVNAITGSDTISTFPLVDGTFLLVAVPEGEYSVEINPGNLTYTDTTITGVNVIANQNVDLGTIQLQNR